MSTDNPRQLTLEQLILEIHAHSQTTLNVALATIRLMSGSDPDFALKVHRLIEPKDDLSDLPERGQQIVTETLDRVNEELFLIHQKARKPPREEPT